MARVSSQSLESLERSTPHGSDRTEEYLEVLFAYGMEGKLLTNAQLANYMGVKPPTAVETLRRLAGRGYLRETSSREVRLSSSGLARGADLVRRHRLTECLLIDIIGLTWGQALDQACRIDHLMSEATLQRIEQVLQEPTTCPHGNHILGTGSGRSQSIELDKALVGSRAVIERITDLGNIDAQLMDFFWQENLRPERMLTIEEKVPSAGILKVSLEDNRTVTLGFEAASKIRVNLRETEG